MEATFESKLKWGVYRLSQRQWKKGLPDQRPPSIYGVRFFFISTFSIVFTDVKGLAFFAFRSENHDRSDFRIRWRLRRERDS